VADLIVLAEDAVKIAMGEKDGAGAAAAHQGVFFAEMGAIGGGDGQIAGAAQAPLPVMAVHQAIVGTEGAII
jgi:hypothetical protein